MSLAWCFSEVAMRSVVDLENGHSVGIPLNSVKTAVKRNE